MRSKKDLEREANSIAYLPKPELKNRIKNFNGPFKLDFSEEYLDKLSVDKLRHILLAALLSSKSHN